MEENGLMTDPCFLGILSSKEQKYVSETIFPDQQLLLQETTEVTASSPSLTNTIPIPYTQTTSPPSYQASDEDTKTRATSTPLHHHLPQSVPHAGHPLPTVISPPAPPPPLQASCRNVSVGMDGMGSPHQSPNKEAPHALSAALDTLTASLNADGTLPLCTFEKIVQELSGIECLQSMLLFRPNKKKGKGGRQPAKDPRMDPAVDPKKAKRIMANRISAAKSKQKQKKLVESLQLQHDTLLIQMLLCGREKEKVEVSIQALENDNKLLDTELQALVEHLRRSEKYLKVLVCEKDGRRVELESMKKRKE